MTPEERIYQGNRAKEVLDNEIFRQAFEQIEQDIIDQWKNSPARAEGDREKLWTYLQLLNKLKANLSSTMETGKLASLEMAHKSGWLKRMTGAFTADE